MDVDLPYVVEYAKSGRASCKKCKSPIPKDKLRVGIMVQSPHFDGKIPLWHHLKCFFLKKKLTSTGDMKNFGALRYEDQEKIKNLMGGGSKSNGKTAAAASASYSGKASDYEFCIEYAKTGKSSCRECSEKIAKDAIRVSKLDYTSEHAVRYGPCPGWRHLDCFVKVKNDLEFLLSGDQLPGFTLLSEEDQDVVKRKIKSSSKRKGESKNGEVAEKKVKRNEKKNEIAIKAQNELYYNYRDQLQKQLKKKEHCDLLIYNDQQPLSGESRILDSLADCMTFGAFEPCPECKGQLKLGTYTYKCTGNLTEWTRCEYKVKVPKRKKFVVPEEYAEKYEFLRNYIYVKQDRVFPENPEAPSTSKSSSVKSGKPLVKFQIVIVGDLVRGKEAAAKTIEELGGKLMKKITKNTTCVITNKEEAEKYKKEISSAEKFNVFVLSEDFLDAVHQGDIVQVIKYHKLFPYGGEPLDKLMDLKVVKISSAKSSSKSVSRIQKVVAQGRAAVDPDSGLENVHVYENNGDVYNVVLGFANIQTGHNSYYKMQILESNNPRPRYHVFYSWGRVGTSIGKTKLESCRDVSEAEKKFKLMYTDKTNNKWENRKNFKKYPMYMYPLDIDYGQDIMDSIPELKAGANSKLPIPVQQLICLIFDVESMKKAMLEFEIDLQKMPLGKLSKSQIQSAYSVLTELMEVIKGDKNNMKIIDASNRFYTLIPHDFGLRKPTMLDTDFMIKAKTEMLDSLLEIEVAYNMLKNTRSTDDPIDMHYKQLNTDIEVLDRSCNEFQILEKYLRNTHAETHNQYKLEIKEIFKVNRYGELDRYNKFKKLHNKKLLWHGSRTTNFAGILSQGLRIAPPEAPSTGYMFGKGIYFADMVSKSANYCFTNAQNPVGLLLLCEVALGNMYERYNAEFVQKLPKDTHSTKGIGKTGPDPTGSIFQDGVEIPLGTPVTDVTKKNHALLYNEYIVYDVNQVNIKYLLEVDFKWRR